MIEKPSEKTQEFIKIISEYFDAFKAELSELQEKIKSNDE